MQGERFPIRFTGLNHLMSLLGMSPGRSWVEVGEDELRVRMGWGFRMNVPRAHVRDARLDERRVWNWGVHGWRGRWLVNGSSSGIVRIGISPPGRARAWPFTVSVREIRVSVVDPEGLIAALGS